MTRADHHSKRTARFTAGYRGKSVALLLVIELLLAQLAIASPQLHDWLHGVDTCSHQAEHSSENTGDSPAADDHVCTITLISEGLFQEIEPCTIHLVGSSSDQANEPALFPNEPAIVRHSARSPPHSSGR